MLTRYMNRVKDYLQRKGGRLPGSIREGIVIDVFLKVVLELFSKIINPLVRKKSELRHKNLEKEKQILLNHFRESDLKYHDCFETFLHFIFLLADRDVPYYQTYIAGTKLIQEEFPKRTKLSMYCHDLKEGLEPRHPAEKYDAEKFMEIVKKRKKFEQLAEAKLKGENKQKVKR